MMTHINDSGNGAGETSERDASPINTALSQGMCDCNCVVQNFIFIIESVTDDSIQKVQEVESTCGMYALYNLLSTFIMRFCIIRCI